MVRRWERIGGARDSDDARAPPCAGNVSWHHNALVNVSVDRGSKEPSASTAASAVGGEVMAVALAALPSRARVAARETRLGAYLRSLEPTTGIGYAFYDYDVDTGPDVLDADEFPDALRDVAFNLEDLSG